MPASVSTSICACCVCVCVCVSSCLFCLHCCCLTALITFVIIRSFSYQRWVFFCVPFVFCSCLHTCYRCLLCFLLSLSCCVLTAAALPTTTSILHSRARAHSLSLSPTPLQLSVCLYRAMRRCNKTSFKVYFLHYLFVLFESKLSHRLME